jgi:hypothetical protein
MKVHLCPLVDFEKKMTNDFDGFWIGFIASYQTHINKEKISKMR